MQSQTGLLDPPVALPANPTTAAERSLVEAYAIRGQEAVDAASELVEAATERLDRQGTELVTQGRTTELRNLLVARHETTHQHHFLAALGNGEEPEPMPKASDVAAELVTW